MPIRFRCVYCNQLLGIARRKAGSVVRCTNCDGQIVVPQPAIAAAKPARPPTNLFEDGDIDELLRPIQESAVFMDSPAGREPADPAPKPSAARHRPPPPTAIETAAVRRSRGLIAGVAGSLVVASFLIGWLLGHFFG
jgi:DNA-directed RNA polymerase subunit RPC12/RpoP